MKNVILAFDSIGDLLHVELFSEASERIAVRKVAADPGMKIPRFDVLHEITGFLAENDVPPESLAKIIFVHGPGRFTAVRTACIVANAFAAEISAQLLPITKESLIAAGGDFNTFISAPLPTVSFAEPLFDGPPSISHHKK